MQSPDHILNTPIEYLKGVGPLIGDMLKKELNLFTFRDLLYAFPFRYVDRTSFQLIKDINAQTESVQLKGTLISIELAGGGRKQRLTALFKDASGFVELIWFSGIKWIEKNLEEGQEYIIYGKPNIYSGKKSIPHPEMEKINNGVITKRLSFEPVYASTEKLNSKRIDSRLRRKLVKNLFSQFKKEDLNENLPHSFLTKYKFLPRYETIFNIHFPSDELTLKKSVNRIKFEELFYLQLRLLKGKKDRNKILKGAIFDSIGHNFNRFYQEKLTFELTNAQKKVIKEIRTDLGSGRHMNRLLQGDVGSGKTVVGLMSILIALDNGYQACLMAPTEILAQQHFISISEMVKGLGIRVAFLSGSVKGQKRNSLLSLLAEGHIHILVGTHALIEEPVVFQNLGLAIIDEQHRFGVEQRSKLWLKNKNHPPHILVMTATPIPRTLAMTVYGDLDVSVIDELPPGRKPITTLHKYESKRAEVIQFMHAEIQKGHQIYVVFPLIDESEKMDLQNLQMGYEQLLQYFPKPEFQISVVHGRMKSKDKDYEMQRFVNHKTHIMVATTVIEVGVNVPNASVMIIENAERFGLSQLHQLRGRVGRGAEQSYCVLMTDYKISKDGKERLQTMCRTNDGFEIAEVDMQLRGPGNLEGTQQSGDLDLKMANLAQDQAILVAARVAAMEILDRDPNLESKDHYPIRQYMKDMKMKFRNWGRIS